ncbi:MAG: PucR family transcriptional regulator [Phototrophicaceae bacterium]|jgi:purine catabolism regulator
MMTVEQALQLEPLKGTQVVAGEAGLQHAISWVHNSGVPDAQNWVNGGELLLTTAINMPTTLDAQVGMIEALAEKGVVAVGVAVGRFIDEIPPEWCAVANRLGLPLLAVPYQAKFIDIARAINEQISQESVAMLRRAMHIQQTLSELVLNGGNLNDLARILADLIGQAISIENERFDALASANIGTIDEARRYTLEHGHTNPALIAALEDEGILHQLRSTRRPVQLPPFPHVGLEMERILAPIVVHGEIYGYMWLIGDGQPLSDLDQMALEIGATVAALMLLHQEAVQTAEASLKGNWLAQLIQGSAPQHESVLTDQALRYGLDLQRPYRMLMLHWTDTEGVPARLYRRVNRLVNEREWQAIVSQFAGQVIVLLSDSEALTDATQRIHEQLGVGRSQIGVSDLQHTPNGVQVAHQHCLEALTIAARLLDVRPTVYFDDLGYLHTLYHAGASSLDGNPFVPLLRALQEEVQADLFHTLEVYLDHGANGLATADVLHIHRSTLNYRLERIRQILHSPLADPIQRMNIHVAVKLMRLFDAP